MSRRWGVGVSGAWPTQSEMTLQALAATYGRYYDLWFDGGTYCARYVFGGEPLAADSPEELDSAIRAHLWRQGAR